MGMGNYLGMSNDEEIKFNSVLMCAASTSRCLNNVCSTSGIITVPTDYNYLC